MLVWRKGNLPLCYSIVFLCTKVRAVLTGRSTVSGFNLAWFSSLSSECLCVFGLLFCLHPSLYLLVR